jgi:hypothetical protein
MSANDNEIVFSALMLLVAFAAVMLGSFFARRRQMTPRLRFIRAYQEMPQYVDKAVESNRKLHISLGASSICNETTLAALAGTEIIYHLIKRQAFTSQMPLITLSDPLTLAIAQDTVRKAYIARQNFLAYRPYAVLWYPSPAGSLIFGAGIASLASLSESPATILIGTFGTEIAFVGESSQRRHQSFVGHSTQLEGQAIAFGLSETPLIGEELFVGEAYLKSERGIAIGSVVGLDILRWVAIALIIIGVIINLR